METWLCIIHIDLNNEYTLNRHCERSEAISLTLSSRLLRLFLHFVQDSSQ